MSCLHFKCCLKVCGGGITRRKKTLWRPDISAVWGKVDLSRNLHSYTRESITIINDNSTFILVSAKSISSISVLSAQKSAPHYYFFALIFVLGIFGKPLNFTDGDFTVTEFSPAAPYVSSTLTYCKAESPIFLVMFALGMCTWAKEIPNYAGPLLSSLRQIFLPNHSTCTLTEAAPVVCK